MVLGRFVDVDINVLDDVVGGKEGDKVVDQAVDEVADVLEKAVVEEVTDVSVDFEMNKLIKVKAIVPRHRIIKSKIQLAFT